MMRRLLLLAIAAMALYLLQRFGLLKWDLIARAFVEHRALVIVSLISQILALVFMMLRYATLLRVFGLKVKLMNVVAATFLSNAIGQWAPGSMAVTEFLRLGLMFKVDKVSTIDSETSACLVATSLYDRLLGFVTLLSMGGLASAVFAFRSGNDPALGASVPLIAGLSAISFAGALSLCLLPTLARVPITKKVIQSAQAFLSRQKKGRLTELARSLLRHAEAFRHVLASKSTSFTSFLVPTAWSFLSIICANFALVAAAEALDSSIPFVAVATITPYTALASLLPLGFAGLGGYQAIVATLLTLFAVDPQISTSASLLANGMALLGGALLGLLFLQRGLEMLLKRKKAETAKAATP